MEAIGQLAGGVAHDFNNALGVIIGYCDLLELQLSPQHPLYRSIEQIEKAGQRAATLTRQLLAFSRKQSIQPVVLSLNSVITDLDKMLRRLIGEDIELKITCEPHLPAIELDPGQIEQVVMNLAVNARDAMPHGGKLSIKTENINLRKAAGFGPGNHVMLTVSDTGCGMDEETIAHIFEPFFTTKGLGKGTGLGLSTVYGIVKQGKGDIRVSSDPGQGTTFKIYFPEAKRAVEAKAVKRIQIRLQGSETVLLVEDEEPLRLLIRECLESNGYTVLVAADGNAAINVSTKHGGPIHLLLTDVILPGMSGRELADNLTQSLPGVKLLYMSGYTDDRITSHGVLDPGIALIEKPFRVESLLHKVRGVLDNQPAEAVAVQ